MKAKKPRKKLHKLKIKECYMDDIYYHGKSFEVRKNDRNFRVGDRIDFYLQIGKHWYPEPYTVGYEITYILKYEDFPQGIKKDYCVLGIIKIKPPRNY